MIGAQAPPARLALRCVLLWRRGQLQHTVAATFGQQVTALAVGHDRLRRLEEGQHSVLRAIGIDAQQAGAMGIVFACLLYTSDAADD